MKPLLTKRAVTVLLLSLGAGPGSLPAFSAPPDCFFGMAFVAPDGRPPPLEMIGSTYGELLVQLGKTLPPETISGLAEAENPFVLKEESGKDASALQRRLHEFESMLRDAHWLTPEVTAEAKRIARELSGGKVIAERKAQQAIGVNNITTFPIELKRTFQVTPDGQWLMSDDPFYGLNDTHRPPTLLYNLVTKQRREIPIPKGYGEAKLGRDGKFIFFPNRYLKLNEVPLENGLFDLKKERWFGEQGGSTPVDRNRIEPGYLTNVVLAQFDTDQNYAFLPTGVRVRLTTADGEPLKIHDGNSGGWEVIPGTDDLLVREQLSKSCVVRRLRYKGDGRTEVLKEWTIHYSDHVTHAVATASNQLLVADFRKRKLLLYPTPDQPSVEALTWHDNSHVDDLVVSPTGQFALALVRVSAAGGDQPGVRMVQIRMDNGEVTTDMYIPGAQPVDSLQISPDARYAYVRSPKGAMRIDLGTQAP